MWQKKLSPFQRLDENLVKGAEDGRSLRPSPSHAYHAYVKQHCIHMGGKKDTLDFLIDFE